MSLLVWPRLVLLVRLRLLGLAAWPVVLYAAAARLVASGFLVAFELLAAEPNSTRFFLQSRSKTPLLASNLLPRAASSFGTSGKASGQQAVQPATRERAIS